MVPFVSSLAAESAAPGLVEAFWILFFSFQSVVLSQSNEIPPPPLTVAPDKRLGIPSIPEFAKSLVKPNEQDDPIKKLQREQLIEALACVESFSMRYFAGDSSNPEFALKELFKHTRNASAAAFNLASTNEKKIECLEYLIETTKLVERVAEDRFNARQGLRLGLSEAKFWRLDAEINLLKFKKDPSIFQFKVDMSPVTKLRGSQEIVVEPADYPDCKKTVHHAETSTPLFAPAVLSIRRERSLLRPRLR
jgi:hypothetical protein